MSRVDDGGLQRNNSFQHLESIKPVPPVLLEEAVTPVSMQPTSRDAGDWPQWKKNVTILMVSFHSMISVFMAAGIVPAAHSMAKSYGVSLPDASYLVSIQVSTLVFIIISS